MLIILLCLAGHTLWAQTDPLVFPTMDLEELTIPDETQEIDCSGEMMPIQVLSTPVEGIERLQTAIRQALRVPSDLPESGTVYVRFTVDRNGKIRKPELHQGFLPSTDQAAVECLQNLPLKLVPATQNGRRVPTTFIVPIRFVVKN